MDCRECSKRFECQNCHVRQRGNQFSKAQLKWAGRVPSKATCLGCQAAEDEKYYADQGWKKDESIVGCWINVITGRVWMEPTNQGMGEISMESHKEPEKPHNTKEQEDQKGKVTNPPEGLPLKQTGGSGSGSLPPWRL